VWQVARMSSVNLEAHLSQIQTLWTLVRQAHAGSAEKGAAQRQLIDRYGGAVRRYLRGALRDPDASDEVFQEFAYRLLHGDLGGADPQRGRFRYYVKGVLFHLIADHQRREHRQPRQIHSDMPEPAVAPELPEEEDRIFLASWRDELLARAWQALEANERRTGQPFFTVLRFKVEHAAMPSAQMAEQLSGKLGKGVTAASVRQTLHRARDRFADLLLDEVVNSLDRPAASQLQEELIDLGLLEYCRPALDRR
jgi:RNA polymerase sigma factor (sigma-70 family)